MLILNDKNIKKTIVEHSFAVDLTYSYHLVDCVGRAIAAKGPSMTSLQVTIFDLANYFCCDSAFCFVKNLKKLNQTKLCDDQNCILPWHRKSPSFLFRTSAPLQRHSLIIRIIRMIMRIIKIIRIIRMIGMRRRNVHPVNYNQ